MLDTVYIDDLEVETLIGVYDFERLAPQSLLLTIELEFDCRPAGQTDDITLALDYDRLSREVRQWSLTQTFELLESYAEALCLFINQQFSIQKISLSINKPAAVKGCSAVGIRILREFDVKF